MAFQRERVQELFNGSAAIRLLVTLNRSVNLYMVYP